MTRDEKGYRKILHDDKSLALFLQNIAKFDRLFCDAMMGGKDFTLRLEVRGTGHNLVHVRVSQDEFDKNV